MTHPGDIPGPDADSASGLPARSSTSDRPQATDAPFAADRLTVLAHELHNLLDGSMRCLLLAMRSIDEASAEQETPLDSARKRIETACTAMERMCDVVHTATLSVPSAVGSPVFARGTPISVASAVEHAVEVLTPWAFEHRVLIESRAGEHCDRVPVGPLYTVILNGLRNAVEAVAGTGRSGTVKITASCEGGEIHLDIIDDGPGLPKDVSPENLFHWAVSTKSANRDRSAGSGIGLALCREIVREGQGRIELRPAASGRGTRLAVSFPIPFDPTRSLGGG